MLEAILGKQTREGVGEASWGGERDVTQETEAIAIQAEGKETLQTAA